LSPSPEASPAESPRRRRWQRVWLLTAGLLLAGLLAFWALAWQRAIDPVATPAAASFEPARLQRGAELAAIGNCASCHTAPGGAPYAGGYPMQTPYGTIYGTNITPEPETGVGGWSEAAFRRALREGVSRNGHLLYPAFPYDHFTQLQDADISALYAFVMTRDPVAAQTPTNQLAFPMQFRPLIAGWNLLFLDKGPRTPAMGQAPPTRGAYLVDALGHCSSCHTPRNVLGAEKRDEAYAGGISGSRTGDWHGVALNAGSPSPVPWTADSLDRYLRTGLVEDHAITAGPMQEVVRNLAQAPAADVRAMAEHIVTLMGQPSAAQRERETASRQQAQGEIAAKPRPAPSGSEDTLKLGAAVYKDNCAVCHDLGRGLSSASGLQLPLAVALHIPDPRNLIHLIREGVQPTPGQAGRYMPGYDGTLSEAQIGALVTWLRHQATSEAPWPDVAQALEQTRKPSP
jgi:mono/diheme cytochrome c family protein